MRGTPPLEAGTPATAGPAAAAMLREMYAPFVAEARSILAAAT